MHFAVSLMDFYNFFGFMNKFSHFRILLMIFCISGSHRYFLDFMNEFWYFRVLLMNFFILGFRRMNFRTLTPFGSWEKRLRDEKLIVFPCLVSLSMRNDCLVHEKVKSSSQLGFCFPSSWENLGKGANIKCTFFMIILFLLTI